MKRQEDRRQAPIKLADLLPRTNVKGGSARPKMLFGATRKTNDPTTKNNP